MRIQLLAGVAVIAVGVGLAPMTFGAAPVHAAPFNPLTPCSQCLPGPGGGPGGQSIAGRGHGVLPVMGVGPKMGQPSVAQPHAHPAGR